MRTDRTYPVGFMDVVDIPKTGGCTAALFGQLSCNMGWILWLLRTVPLLRGTGGVLGSMWVLPRRSCLMVAAARQS